MNMQVNANSREQAARIAAAALEFTGDVRIQNQSGYEACYVVEFDERVVMNEEELASVVSAAYSSKTQRAIAKYTKAACIEAHRMHSIDGEGGSTVGFYLGLTTRQADAAINAGQEIAGPSKQ
jgi:hypothetical protein